MKKFVTAVLFCGLLVSPLAGVTAEGEKPYFDMKNCDMCKSLTAETGLMENMQWENHSIANGLMNVCKVSDGFEKAYARANKKMQASGELMMKGEKMNVCGYCESFGSLFAAGAQMEQVETNVGHVMLITSNDAELVGKIHAHVKRTNAETAKMKKAQQPADPHEGHSHD